jgi:electron transfer flavoprotein alpha subunit
MVQRAELTVVEDVQALMLALLALLQAERTRPPASRTPMPTLKAA